MNEKTVGALISPDGDPSKALTIDPDEFDQLKDLLKLVRESSALDGTLTSQILQDLTISAKTGRAIDPSWVVRTVTAWANDYGTTPYDVCGVFSDEEKCALLSKSETLSLRHYLQVLQRGGWYGDWLRTSIGSAASGSLPADKLPTSFAVMGSLTQDAAEFEEKLNASREMAQQRPDLVTPAREAKEPVSMGTANAKGKTSTRSKIKRRTRKVA